MLENKKILFIASHTDDVELGAGGTLARAVREGCDVHVLALSVARTSVPKGMPEDTLSKEFVSSMATYGLSVPSITICDFPVRLFPKLRQEILEKLLEIRNYFEPELVFTHCSFSGRPYP